MLFKIFTIVTFACCIQSVCAQNVGIGTTNPLNKLSVEGKVNITDSLGIGIATPTARLDLAGNIKIADGSQGAGKVLTSDANGLASWVTPASNGWGLTGNSGTSSATHFLGTTDNRSLRFRTNNTEKMIIDSLGNVGIGTTTPATPLQVATGPGKYSTAISILPSTHATSRRAELDIDDWSLLQDIDGNSGTKNFAIYQRSANSLRLFIGTNGNIGIGNTAPTTKLDIAGNIRIGDGTQGAGKVLTSDANGKASWISPSLVPDALPTIQIGTQKWMRYNLDVAFYRNGDSIPQVTDPATWANLTTGAWCYYNNDPITGSTYGKLYNWYAVNDPRGLAPQGWHIPSLTEWNTLGPTLGGVAMAGGKLKQAGTSTWSAPNSGGNNNSGWEGLPGGYRDGGFLGLGIFGGWWTSNSNSPTQSRYGFLYYVNTSIDHNFGDNTAGYSVRCIRD